MAMALELEPRPQDEGWASYWKASNPEEEERLKAAFAARRDERKKLGILRIPKSMVSRLGIPTRMETDEETFECVGELHCLVELESEEVRLRLAETLWEALSSSVYSRDEIYKKTKKSEINDLLMRVYQDCQSNNGFPDLDKASEWVRDDFGLGK